MIEKNKSIWKTCPSEAFGEFVQSNDFLKTGKSRSSEWNLQKKSIAVYRYMFDRYLKWLKLKNLELHHLNTDLINQFIAELERTTDSEIKWVYLRILERTYSHLVECNLVKSNPITSFLEEIGPYQIECKNEEMCFLSIDDYGKLLLHIEQLSKSEKLKNMRDAALATVLVGCGLKLSEALSLKRSDLIQNNETIILSIKSLGLGNQRNLNLNELLSPGLLNAFLIWANRCNEEMEFIFIGTNGAHEAMNHATAFRRIKSILKNAKINSIHEGGRVLRNTFAILSLKTKMDKEKLADILGLKEVRSLDIYEYQAKKLFNN